MYPVTYEADYQRERSRLTTFFRPIVAIPWIVVAVVYAIAQLVAIVLAWFALIIVGRYPQGLYNFVGGVLRYQMRVAGWVSLQTDAWPPFGISEDPNYPIRVNLLPRAGRQSRLKALFRLILIIPLIVLSIGMSLLMRGAVVVAWLTIVFRGYQPAAIHNVLAFLNGWDTRASAYGCLLRDEYPPVGDENPVDVAPPAAVLPAAEPVPLAPPSVQADIPALPAQADAPAPPPVGQPAPPAQENPGGGF